MKQLKILQLYALGCGSLLFYPFIQIYLRACHPKLYRFYNLRSFVGKAYRKANYSKAETLALEYLELAEHFKGDWNYGNAIHSGHQVLGLVRLKEGRVESAKKHLLAAGRTPGSPQLNSYGPNLILARELFLKGETEVVIRYLDLVAEFWASEKKVPSGVMEAESKARTRQNKALIEEWKSTIRNGQLPQDDRWSNAGK